jgi:GT2 family glycosyltransferase
MMVSNQFVEQVGMMSTDYFLYFEELDWIIRGKKHGFSYTFCPGSIIYHKEGKSTGGTSNKDNKSYIADYYSITNRLVFTGKYFPSYRFPVYLSLMGVLLNRIKRGQFSRVKMVLDILFASLFSSHRK